MRKLLYLLRKTIEMTDIFIEQMFNVLNCTFKDDILKDS